MSTPVSATQAQMMARDVLRVVGIDTADRRIVLTDRDVTGARAFIHLVNPGQITYATEQFTLTTGLSVDTDALVDALPWAHEGEQ